MEWPFSNLDGFNIYPANIFVTSKERMASAIDQIAVDLGTQCDFFAERRKNRGSRPIERTCHV